MNPSNTPRTNKEYDENGCTHQTYTAMNRNIIDIIDRILAEIPEGFDAKNTLTTDLIKIRKDALYRAPEQQSQDWNRLSEMLNFYLPRPIWKQNIADIFEGREYTTTQPEQKRDHSLIRHRLG